MEINNYYFDKPLSSENSGFAKWGIGVRGGRRFFVKEFLAPIYPIDRSAFTEEKRRERLEICQEFVDQKVALYDAIREAAEGHVVSVEQFFRVGSKYYISTMAVEDRIWTVPEIADCLFPDRLRLCCSISHAMACIHERGIVHADIKSNNLLIVQRNGFLMPYLIDFDCSFFENEKPELGDELNGDMLYLSPEAFMHIAGIESNLSRKMDVFSLGLLFSEYLTGSMPKYDETEYQYAYESVLDDHPLSLEGFGNEACADLIAQMLQKDPDLRPDMRTVFHTFHGLLLDVLDRKEPEAKEIMQSQTGTYFKPAGDL